MPSTILQNHKRWRLVCISLQYRPPIYQGFLKHLVSNLVFRVLSYLSCGARERDAGKGRRGPWERGWSRKYCFLTIAYFYATIYETLLSLEWLLKTETPEEGRENKRLGWQGDLTFSHSFLSKVSSLTLQLCRVHQSWNSNTFTLNMQSSKIQNQKPETKPKRIKLSLRPYQHSDALRFTTQANRVVLSYKKTFIENNVQWTKHQYTHTRDSFPKKLEKYGTCWESTCKEW